MDVVYLDNNATTKPAPEVVDAMMPYLTEWYGNPSSVHRFGQRARQAVDEARGKIAELVGCSAGEIVFTGGGSGGVVGGGRGGNLFWGGGGREAVTLAIGGFGAARGERRRIVTCAAE